MKKNESRSMHFRLSTFALLVARFYLVFAKKDSDDKIVGGRVASNIPFLVSIQEKGRHLCGGSLITLSTILTACHCVGGYKPAPKHPEIEVPDVDEPKKYQAIAGSFDLYVRSFRAQKRQIREMFAHPSCVKVSGTLQWDFGIMIVDQAFEESKFVQPTKLYSLVKKTFDERIAQFQGKKKKQCWVMGWGKAVLNAEGASTSRYLKAVKMRIINDEECQYYLSQQNPMYVNYSFGQRAQMCAVGIKWAESDCQGDSGGPVFCKGYLMGTVSYGFDCGRGDQPAVYTKLSEFLDWYKKYIKTAEMVRAFALSLRPLWHTNVLILFVTVLQYYLMFSSKIEFG